MTLDLQAIRSQFPALSSGLVYFDNPGGTQVPNRVIDRMVDYLVTKNANHEGAFPTSQRSDDLVDQAHRAMAEMLNAAPDEIIFGANMTTLTLHLSRSIARELRPGDEIIVTRLDHDANISPWIQIAEDRGCTLRWLDFDVEDCTLRLPDLESLLTSRTRLVAVGYASNAVGTINPVERIVQLAHQAGAWCLVDAVQFAPHGAIDVRRLECDFLVVSAYKFFGPHAGVLYGRRDLLERLFAYKVRPAPDAPPGKFETGTGNFEAIAGTLGAVEYLASLAPQPVKAGGGLRGPLGLAMQAIQEHERNLSTALIDALQSLPGVRIHGITDPGALNQRVPTVSFTAAGHHPRSLAAALGEQGIQVWDGNYYAPAVTERLGLESQGGMLRVGLVHYNTVEEIQRLVDGVRPLLGRR
jgi:cysteine desulfurase family protein (TIGR01976 family)